MGRLAGIDDNGAFNEEAEEVKEARRLVVKAFQDFFVIDARQALQDAEGRANAQRAALLQRYPGATGVIDRIYPLSVEYGADTLSQIATGYGLFMQAAQGPGIDYVGGLGGASLEDLGLWDGTGGFDAYEAAQATREAFLNDLAALAETIQQREALDQAVFEQQMQNIFDLFVAAWEELKQIYDDLLALTQQGQYLFATHYLATFGAQAAPGMILSFVAMAIANAAGGAVVLAVSRSVFQAAVRVGITITPPTRQLRKAAASAIVSVHLTHMRPSALSGGFEPGRSLGALRPIDTNHLPPGERRLVETTEGSLGSRAEGDAPLDESPADAPRRDADARREDVAEDGSYRNTADPEGVRRAADGEAMVQESGQWTRISEASNNTKGRFGEMMADHWAANQNPPWERINGPAATMNTPGHQGLDAVYRNPNPPPDYFVADAKYGSSGLGRLVDGTQQMSPDWIRTRLDQIFGDDADDVLRSHEPGILRVDKNGNVVWESLEARTWRVFGASGGR